MNHLKRLVITALMAALTTIATIAIQIPTPLSGYVHLGDSLVLLCGIILGPFGGAFAAGVGSMMADIVTGYFIYAPATFIIKALAAFLSGFVYHKIRKHLLKLEKPLVPLLVSGACCMVTVTLGYFIYEIFLYGIPASAANSLFNIFQGFVGILVAIVLFPVLSRIPDVTILLKQYKV